MELNGALSNLPHLVHLRSVKSFTDQANGTKKGLSIFNGSIVWVNGPFWCGVYRCMKLFKSFMLHLLNVTEGVKVEGDYRHNRWF